jgi:hypothetical protein
MKNTKYLLPALFTGVLALAQSSAFADDAIDIENNYTTAAQAVTYDDNGTTLYPIVTAILSAPHGSVYNPGATLDGYTYSSWAYYAADTTGSLDIFYSSSAAGPLANYGTPTVGDTILVQGTYSPFDGIPEIENGTPQAINVFGPGSSGNPPYAPGAPALTSIPTINVGTNGNSINMSGLAGYLLSLNNVTISSVSNFTAGTTTLLSNWATHANNEGLITDQGGHSMTMYLWASSYSTCGAIAASGGAIPTGLVDMTGFVDDFGNSAEFIPISITAVPEPAALSLCGLGSLLAFAGYRLRKKA